MKVLVIRNTVNGPAKGTEPDLPDADARALIACGTAVVAPDKPETVQEEAPKEEEPAKHEKPAKKKH